MQGRGAHHPPPLGLEWGHAVGVRVAYVWMGVCGHFSSTRMAKPPPRWVTNPSLPLPLAFPRALCPTRQLAAVEPAVDRKGIGEGGVARGEG